jgi:hypothetical protein
MKNDEVYEPALLRHWNSSFDIRYSFLAAACPGSCQGRDYTVGFHTFIKVKI